MFLRRIPSAAAWPIAFGDLEGMRRSLERLFDTLEESGTTRSAGVYPPLNVSENVESVVVRAELPGVDPDDLDITMKNTTLTIAGRRAMPEEGDEASYHRRERDWGAFRRSLEIPVPVDPDHVQARYRDGILTVTLNKAPEARPRRISVQAEA